MNRQEAESLIGKKVRKKSNKPFKSMRRFNTVKGVHRHALKRELSFTFEEDDSFISCEMCIPMGHKNE